MVLSRACCALLAIASGIAGIAGCNQSLFDAHSERRDGGPGDDAPGDGAIAPITCEDPCLADATGDFPDLSNAEWTYLDDRRNRLWIPMIQSGEAMMSVNLNNRIERCSNPSSEVCKALPDALLVSSAGMQSAADPAIEFRSAGEQVIQLVFHVYVPLGTTAHKVRLYRNSREDVLLTEFAVPGATISRTITVDALADDRFLVSLEPTGTPGGPVALRFFVRGPLAAFPSTCQVALPFTVGTNPTTLDNRCGQPFEAKLGTATVEPLLATGLPTRRTSEIKAGHLESTYHFDGTQTLTRGSAMTVQLWVQYQMSSDPRVWLFSDVHQTTGGGLGIAIANPAAPKLEVTTHNGTAYMTESTTYENPSAWHFIRVIHAGNLVEVCVDGSRRLSAPLDGPTTAAQVPLLGKSPWDDTSYLTGEIDDLRVFSEALSCDN